MEKGVPGAVSELVYGGLGAEPSFLSGCDLTDSSKAILEEGLRFLGEEEAVQGYRAGTVAELAPAEAEARAVQLFQLAESG